MGKEMKNVIVLKNVYSDTFEEVIFVLKKNAGTLIKGGDMVSEAKKIIEEYISRGGEYSKPVEIRQEIKGFERGKKLNIILNVSLVLSIMLFVLLVVKIM